MTAARRVIALSALFTALPTTSMNVYAANGCPETWEGAAGPLPGGIGPADFAATPEACGASEMSARLRAALLVARSMPDFYGSLLTGIMLRTRKTIDASSWVSFAFDAINHRYINNAGLTSSGFSLGPPTLGYHRALYVSAAMATAVHVRALLPLDTARANSFATGLEMGGGVRAPASPRTVIDGGLALVAPTTSNAGQVHARFAAVALAEAWYSPRPAVALGAGAAAEAELAPTPTLVTVVPRLTTRVALRKQFWLAALVELPVAGRDRTDVVASLTVGYLP